MAAFLLFKFSGCFENRMRSAVCDDQIECNAQIIKEHDVCKTKHDIADDDTVVQASLVLMD